MRRTLYNLCRAGAWATGILSTVLMFGCATGPNPFKFYGGPKASLDHRPNFVADAGVDFVARSLEVRRDSTCPRPRRRVHFPRSYVPHHYPHRSCEP